MAAAVASFPVLSPALHMPCSNLQCGSNMIAGYIFDVSPTGNLTPIPSTAASEADCVSECQVRPSRPCRPGQSTGFAAVAAAQQHPFSACQAGWGAHSCHLQQQRVAAATWTVLTCLVTKLLTFTEGKA